MTRLMKFLALVAVVLSVWLLILSQFYRGTQDLMSLYVLLPLPLHLVILFGLYSAFIVLQRTFNFNSCPEAAEELNEQVKEAREDLRRKGFKF